jgi:hypothetical protein
MAMKERPARSEDPHGEVLSRLAAETGARLGELGVRPGDERWIRLHAETLESLFEPWRPRLRRAGWIYRLARKAARTAR